jgi:Icc-related predicted phosphoesterase
MMTVYAISDLHGSLPEIPRCDLLVLGGDYCTGRDEEEQLRFLGGPFKEWLTFAPARHIVGIAGNHDFVFQNFPEAVSDLPWHYLQDEGITIEGISIYGTPWSPTFGKWAFMKDDNELANIYAKIPEKLDILISHSPAFSILDKSVYGDFCGSRQLRERIREVIPDTVICGHIHEAHGIYDDGATRYFNVSHVDEGCWPKHKFTYIPLRSG